MKASELINELVDFMARYGDNSVVVSLITVEVIKRLIFQGQGYMQKHLTLNLNRLMKK